MTTHPATMSPLSGAAPVEAGEAGRVSAELASLCARLQRYVTQLRTELVSAEERLTDYLDQNRQTPRKRSDLITATEHLQVSARLADETLDLLTCSTQDLDPAWGHRYGQCHQCGKPIGADRLHTLPRATLCRSCEQQD